MLRGKDECDGAFSIKLSFTSSFGLRHCNTRCPCHVCFNKAAEEPVDMPPLEDRSGADRRPGSRLGGTSRRADSPLLLFNMNFHPHTESEDDLIYRTAQTESRELTAWNEPASAKSSRIKPNQGE
jgi:hypothetical protein